MPPVSCARFKRTGKRNEIFLASKFGLAPEPGKVISGDPAYVRKAIEKSLKRLGVETIDLYYLHRYVSSIGTGMFLQKAVIDGPSVTQGRPDCSDRSASLRDISVRIGQIR